MKRGGSLLKCFLAIWRMHQDGFVLSCNLYAVKPIGYSYGLYFYLQPQAFNFIHSVMTEEQYTEADKEEVAKAVVESFQVLLPSAVHKQ